jgi:hypothetical protein
VRSASGRLLPAVFTSVLLLGCACGSTPPASSATSVSTASPLSSDSPSPVSTGVLDPAVSMPYGFPSDFPIYPNARLTQASQVSANGQTTWGMLWETRDGVDSVQTFYLSKLNQGDFTVTFNGSTNGVFSAIFSRRSNQKDAGILGVELQSDVTHITLAFGMTV